MNAFHHVWISQVTSVPSGRFIKRSWCVVLMYTTTEVRADCERVWCGKVTHIFGGLHFTFCASGDLPPPPHPDSPNLCWPVIQCQHNKSWTKPSFPLDHRNNSRQKKTTVGHNDLGAMRMSTGEKAMWRYPENLHRITGPKPYQMLQFPLIFQNDHWLTQSSVTFTLNGNSYHWNIFYFYLLHTYGYGAAYRHMNSPCLKHAPGFAFTTSVLVPSDMLPNKYTSICS